jgi:hypothetical protein
MFQRRRKRGYQKPLHCLCRECLTQLLGFVVLFSVGCSTTRVTNPARTATEQFLLSQAAVKAVEPLSFDALYGRKVFLDQTYFSPSEREFVLGEFRAKLLLSGVQLVTSPEPAEVIMEVRSSGVGIDRYESLVGVPSIAAPAAGTAGTGTGALAPSLITPELAATKNIKQIGYASIAYVAYWKDTGEVVASSQPSVGRTYRVDHWFFGFGPRTAGTVPTVDHTVTE